MDSASELSALRGDLMMIRQDLGVLDARADALENWRERYLTQDDQVVGKLFTKVDELVAALGGMRADLARMRGERDAEGRVTIAIIGLLSALCGGLATNIFHWPSH
jgi:phosphoglycolate phosphatase-like HAD superfamily hydrolase